MEKVENPVLKPNKIVALIFYVFMFLLGSGFVLMFVAMIYGSMNSNIDIALLFQYLADPTDLDTADLAMQKAYNFINAFGQMAAYLIMLVVVGFFMRDTIKEDTINFKMNYKRNLIFIAIATVVFYGITFVIDSLIIGPLVGESQNQESIVQMIQGGSAFAMFIAVVICAPIVEELIYRKAIFSLLEKKPIVISYVVSIVAFALPHMISTSFEDPVKWLLLSVPYVVSALLFAIIYHKSGKNIYSTWFIHMVNNLISFILIFCLI